MNKAAKDFLWRRPGVPDRTLLMGILNITPDSFSDGGKFDQLNAALDRARILVEHGADMIDIGAESSRPGATAVSAEEEWERLKPILQHLDQQGQGVPVSVDTYKSEVAAKALKYNVAIINDIWGLQKDRSMARIVAEAEAGLVIMDNRKELLPGKIYHEVVRFFEKSLLRADQAGISRKKVALDPGIGFGKSYEQNLEMIAKVGDLVAHFGLPVLLGVSRKSVIGTALHLPVDQREEGTIAISALAVRNGVKILRVHDVEANIRAIRMAEAINESTNYAHRQPEKDCIGLRGLRFHAYHGVLSEERAKGQAFLVDVYLFPASQLLGLQDDLSKTVNYASVYEMIRSVVLGVSVRLIETVAENIANKILSEFPAIEKVRVRLHKPEAPIPGEFADVFVDITRG